MRYKIDKILSMVAVLLILQAGVAYALPADGHLNLCFGLDGHIDISQNDCINDSSQVAHQIEDVFIPADDHHNDCLDVTIGCVSLDYSRTSTTERSSYKTTKPVNAYSLHPAEKYAFSASHHISQFPRPITASSYFAFLRTVVFLI